MSRPAVFGSGGRWGEGSEDLFDRSVLRGEVRLDLIGFLEDGSGVVVGGLGARVGCCGLNVLADDDDREEHELQERLGDPCDELPVLNAERALTSARSVKRYAHHMVPTTSVIFNPTLALMRPISP